MQSNHEGKSNVAPVGYHLIAIPIWST